MEKIKVLLIDDHSLMIEGVKSCLAHAESIQVVGFALSAADGLNFLQHNAVEVVLTDINLPDTNGIEVCKKIRGLFPRVKILAFSNYNQYDYISEMLQGGASGYILKNATGKELIEAIQAARDNKKYFSAEVTETLWQRSVATVPTLPRLTRREKEVLQLIASGNTNQEIADKLFISVLTAISHRKNLLTKFEAVNTATLISIASKHGLL